MNIIIIPAFFRDRVRPTLGSFFWEQACALQAAGHSVSILYCDTYSIKTLPWYLFCQEEEKSKEQGIWIYRCRSFCPAKHGIHGYRKAFTRGICALYEKYFSGQKPDLIHAHCSIWAGAAAWQLSQKTGIPYYVTEHATLFGLHPEQLCEKNNNLIRQIFRDAKKTACVSASLAELLQPYRADWEIVENVVDCSAFSVQKEKETEQEKEQDKPLTFLSICHMQTEAQLLKKGMDTLLDAWALFVKKYPEARLEIGGGGKAKAFLQDWVEKRGLEKSVQLLGALGRGEVALRMQACDCFVLPSRYETFGVVYIEALACGKPVIAAKNGGPDTFVSKENGLLIAPGNVTELVEALWRMSKTLQSYDAEKLSAFARERFSPEAIAKRLEAFYGETPDNHSDALL